MVDQYLLGVDIGTASSKGVLVRTTGEAVASHVVEHQTSMPRPGHFEHDADAIWWHDFVVIAKEILRKTGVDPKAILGIGVSAISPAIVPVDKDGQPLRPGILYGIDTRATQEIQEIESILGRETLFERFGAQLSSQAAGPKIRWIRNREPEVWKRTDKILSAEGYIVYKLTGEATLDIYDAAAYAPLFDGKILGWNSEMEEIVGPVRMMPRLTWTAEVGGRVHAAAASLTGLAVGTPVITGTADAAAEAISAGLANDGDIMVMYGSTVFFILKTNSFFPSRKFWPANWLDKGTFAVAGGMSTSGVLTKWFRDQLGHEEMLGEKQSGRNAYAALADLAQNSQRGANGVITLPYFAGERTPLHDPDARGVFFGMTLATTRADLYRSVLEGIGYGIRHNFEAMRAEGMELKRVLAVGGGTLNPFWMQVVSDIVDIEQYIPEQQIGASFGDAFMAGVGIGLFNSTADAGQWVKFKTIIKPDATAHEEYGAYYEIYRELYEKTADSMHKVAALQR